MASSHFNCQFALRFFLVPPAIFLFLFHIYNSSEFNGTVASFITFLPSEIPARRLSLLELYSKEFRKVKTFLATKLFVARI